MTGAILFPNRKRMTVYSNGSPEAPGLKPGDVLFMAGNPKHFKADGSGGLVPEHPPFEHVALVAHATTPQTREDWLELRIYGLPESRIINPELETMKLNSTRFWEGRSWLRPDETTGTALLGHPTSIWNLIMRAAADEHNAEAILTNCAFEAGSARYRKASHYHVQPMGDGCLMTNCLGFVHHVLTREWESGDPDSAISKETLLVPEFGQPYTVPYVPSEERVFPAPGHLAQSLDRDDRSRPYGENFTREDAEAGALARFFLEGRRVPRCTAS